MAVGGPRGFLVVLVLAQAGSPGIVRAQTSPPDSAEILRADAYVAEYDASMGGRAILRRNQRPDTEIEPGQLLYGGDVVEIATGRPRVSIKSPGRDRPFYLPEDGRAFRIASRRPDGSGGSLLPPWVRNLFARQRLSQTRATMARDVESLLPFTAPAACEPPSRVARSSEAPVVRPVPQKLAGERSRITVAWGQMQVDRVEIRYSNGELLSSRDVAGASTTLDFDPRDRDRVGSIRLSRADGRLLMDVPIQFVRPDSEGVQPRSRSDEAKLVEALNDLKPECGRREARTLEAMSRIAELKDRSLAATVVFRTLENGDISW